MLEKVKLWKNYEQVNYLKFQWQSDKYLKVHVLAQDLSLHLHLVKKVILEKMPTKIAFIVY